ncbi:MAG: type II toxin-antitoxin system VapC family toxin [Chitinophagaceae bacterium]|nr:type II toxin-antitoxin system VapC family toxin [Rubrivivax sp.]
MIVIDCSYALAMVMPDEQRPASMHATTTTRLLVPSIWPYEVANAFRSAVRRGRVAAAEMLAVVARIEALQIEPSGTLDAAVRQRYLTALSHDLTAYDAAYVDLASQRRCALATLDARLALAARHVGLDVVS